MRGRIESLSDPDCCFDLEARFRGVLFPGQFGYPPAGSPQIGDLPDALLVENGGPVDPDTFNYYPDSDGVLYGCKGYEGAVVRIERNGPAFQTGFAANDKDEDFGASGWFNTFLVRQSSGGKTLPATGDGDLNHDLVTCPTPMAASIVR